MIKTLRKLGIEGNFLNLIKGIYEKPIISGKRLKAFPLRSGTRQKCSVSPLLFKHVLEIIARIITKEKREKKKKRIHIGKEESKTISIFR